MTEICGRYTEKQISRFIDKELPQKQLWQIHEHLDTCPACRDLAGQFREVTRSFNELAEPPGMGIDPALLHRKLKQPAEKGIGTCFLLKKVSKIPKVKNITVPLIQAQHVVLVSGEQNLSQGKNQIPKNLKRK